MDIDRVIDLHRKHRDACAARTKAFYAGETNHLVIQRAGSDMFGTCNTVDEVTRNNLAYLERAVGIEWTDEVPHLEPWVGTGVYAEAFGCQYHWRDDAAPHVNYLHHKVEEVRDIQYPDWKQSTLMQMVLDCIGSLKEATKGAIPISLTDTQSSFDTATLILDAAELFTSCYVEPDIVKRFMSLITDLIIEFSRVQADAIGEDLLAAPGHIMAGVERGRGISISDDNLAVSSPTINEEFALPEDQRIGEAFGGIAVHSCGSWAHTMKLLPKFDSIFMIDCAVESGDPNPNMATDVRDALRGSDVIVKARVGSVTDNEEAIRNLAAPDLRLVLEIGYDPERAEENYKRATDLLQQTMSA